MFQHRVRPVGHEQVDDVETCIGGSVEDSQVAGRMNVCGL